MDQDGHGSGVGEDGVRALASAAGLPLGEERVGLVAVLLDEWLRAANELSRTMSAAPLRDVAPITVLVHPSTDVLE